MENGNDSDAEVLVAAIVANHQADPAGEALRYHEALLEWALLLDPSPSEALRLAARVQHLRRWEVPRDAFPDGRVGYHEWRRAATDHTLQTAKALLLEHGVNEVTYERVDALVRKRGLKNDADAQCLQDAVSLTFLELQFEAFAAKHSREKTSAIVAKTWKKMSARGQERALELAKRLPAEARQLLQAALA